MRKGHKARAEVCEQGGVKKEIGNQSDDAVGTDVRVLHNAKDAFFVPSASEAVAKVGKSVFVQCARQPDTGDDCQNTCRHGSEDLRCQIKDNPGGRACEKADNRPVEERGGIVSLFDLHDAPERLSGEKHNGGEKGFHLLKSIW